MLVSLVKNGSKGTCTPHVALNTWLDLTASISVFSVAKNPEDTCTGTFQFRVRDLSYAVHQAPGRNGTSNPYAQALLFTMTSP